MKIKLCENFLNKLSRKIRQFEKKKEKKTVAEVVSLFKNKESRATFDRVICDRQEKQKIISRGLEKGVATYGDGIIPIMFFTDDFVFETFLEENILSVEQKVHQAHIGRYGCMTCVKNPDSQIGTNIIIRTIFSMHQHSLFSRRR